MCGEAEENKFMSSFAERSLGVFWSVHLACVLALLLAHANLAMDPRSERDPVRPDSKSKPLHSDRAVKSQTNSYRGSIDSNLVLLMIDVSATKEQIEIQQQASKELVAALPPESAVAVIAFSTRQRLLCNPTDDRIKIDACIESVSSRSLWTSPGLTALFESLVFAVETAKAFSGVRSIVLFTDGADSRSKNATAESTLERISASGAVVFPVHVNCQCLDQNGAEESFENQNIGTLGNTIRRVVIGNSSAFSLLRFSSGQASVGIEYMESLASASGGRAFFSWSRKDLSAFMANIGGLIGHLIPLPSADNHGPAVTGALTGIGRSANICQGSSENQTFGFQLRRIIKMRQPDKRKELAASGIGGTVSVLINVDQGGRVTTAKAISGHPQLRPLAEAAAVKLRLTEIKKCGREISSSEVVDYGFEVARKLNGEGNARRRAAGLELKASQFIRRGGNENFEQALNLLHTAQEIYAGLGDEFRRASVLETYAVVYDRLGKWEESLGSLREAESLYSSLGLVSDRTFTLIDIASLLLFRGDSDSAMETLQSALGFARDLGDLRLESAVLKSIGAVYSASGDRARALESYRESLADLFKNSGSSLLILPEDRLGAASTLNHIGALYAELGENRIALGHFFEAQRTFAVYGDSKGEIASLNNIGLALFNLGDRKRSVELFQRALSLSIRIGYKQGASAALNNLGSLYMDLRNYEVAKSYYEESLPINKELVDRRSEARNLNNLGLVYAYANDDKAFEFLHQSLRTQSLVGDRAGEAKTLRNLMWSWNRFGNRPIAIFFGKQSVNRYQELRKAAMGLEDSLRKSYLEGIEDTYKKLADLLIADGRLVEAEQILRMLKEEEVFDFLRRERSDASDLAQRADLTPREAEALKRYNEIAEKLTELGREFGKLQDLVAKGVTLSPDQEARYKELSARIEDASRVFQVFLRQLAEEFSKKPNTTSDVGENLALQSDLKSWGKGLVFVYTLAGEDRFRSIVVTPETQTNQKSEISSEDLNRKISAFREAVRDPSVDPRPLGKELYDIIIAPIERDLKGADARTILWSLDGNLRLLPMGALWDGEQYFAEKYRNVLVTLASRTRLGDEVASDWRALGLGVSEGRTVTDPGGARDITFDPLPAVPEELAAIVRSDSSPEGVLPGESYLNSGFNEKELKQALLKNFKVIHIASHFSLNAGDSTKSFLLLGDGDVLTVDEIKNNPEFRFNGVELLTLSACQTAVTGKDSTGKEVEGFGYVAQRKGAKAILATLWSVEDESTRLLMAEFYRLRNENPGMTKAEALQRAQMKMIKGEIRGNQTADGRGVDKAKKSDASAFTADPDAPYSHPYFWSPFVLIGNWK
ncbi:MAG: CHAT domain-containing protein [Acidobacteriota bacterium]|nr:MAG: CHAT domain-containing protein [Acidobacteriota bacterium]